MIQSYMLYQSITANETNLSLYGINQFLKGSEIRSSRQGKEAREALRDMLASNSGPSQLVNHCASQSFNITPIDI